MDETTNISSQDDFMEVMYRAVDLKPTWFIIPDVNWKYGVRSVLRGKNVMVIGSQGAGKTVLVRELANALKRPFFRFNLGAMQDARISIVGNTHYDVEKGTVFTESEFVRAMTTPNAVILLDELTRAPHDVWNLLMTVLDGEQRYLRLDEDRDYREIEVAPGVSFFATANIGNQFTATRTLDRAIQDRFTILEMPILDSSGESRVIAHFYPTLGQGMVDAISEIAHHTRKVSTGIDPKLETGISTRMSIEVASLLVDDFTLEEAAEVAIYPFFEDDGSPDSDRTYVKQLVQKYLDFGGPETLFGDKRFMKAQESF
jgi:MoxR-like ATPase